MLTYAVICLQPFTKRQHCTSNYTLCCAAQVRHSSCVGCYDVVTAHTAFPKPKLKLTIVRLKFPTNLTGWPEK